MKSVNSKNYMCLIQLLKHSLKALSKTTGPFAFAILAGLSAHSAPLQFQSTADQTALVELYTSEGCSSCPPAESWLSRLKEKNGLWSEFVPIAFHVDYWDNLGWRDKWASKEYSDRQRTYAGVWASENIYTPEFVLNGREWHNWFGIKGAPGLSDTKAGILKVSSEDTNHWQVHFMPTAGATTGYEINAALLLSGLGSDVKSGENGGRHLEHDFVALTLVNQTLARQGDGFQGAFTLAAARKTPQGRLGLAVWVTHHGRLEPLQALGGWLEPAENSK
jgi:hypothetical protein